MSHALASAAGLILFFLAAPPPPSSQDAARQAAAVRVGQIERADYEGDRAALKRLHEELAPFVGERQIASRVQYWRGFALWRRALNGFNESADKKELGDDLTQAVADFRDAAARDPALVDAKVGEGSCLANLAFLHMSDRARGRELLLQSAAVLKSALAAAPDNPRLLWVQGANQWYSPPAAGGGQAAALATYERGLALARQQKGRTTDPLEPAWGEPELLMNLAFANLNRAAPDLAAAERYAESALALVPYWHYVRDILLVDIRKAKAKL